MEYHNKPQEKTSMISSPVSIALLRRQSIKFICHIIWLKMMTLIKLIMDGLSLILSVSCISAILLYNQPQMHAVTYPISFLILTIVDIFACKKIR